MLVVETLIAIAIALTTAFGSLVADDIISADNSCAIGGLPDFWSHHCSSPARLAWFVGSAALLVAMIALRHWMINHNGTLYYLRLLPASSPDRMRGAMDMAMARSLDFRTATGWFGADGDVLDLRGEVARLSNELERAMNDDDEATGYLIAPNLSFPAALAMGYDVLIRERTSLAEVPEVHRKTRLPGGDTGMRTVYFDDGYDEWASRQWIAHHDQPDPEIALTTLGAPPADGHAVRRVWLSLQLGATGPVSQIDSEHPLRDTCDVVVVAGPSQVIDDEVQLSGWELPTRRRVPGASGRAIDSTAFARVLVELAGAIEHVLDEYPEADILLCADLPKSVEFALGYVISERKGGKIVGKRTGLRREKPDASPAERAQAHAENSGLSSLSRFWRSVTPILVHHGEAHPTIVHPAQRAHVVHALVDGLDTP